MAVIILVCHVTALWAQQLQVTGTVTSGSGEPLPGVNVVVKETTTGTITDMDGNYSIKVPSGDAILVFSFVGYVEQEIPVGNQTVIDITMAESIEAIDEVVVVGYGTQKKVNLTGAVTPITAENIASRPATNISSALQGLAPGVTVTQNFGTPGNDNAIITIRGRGSLESANSPLVLVDGIQANINDVNPEDIESISVLKDAASAAIYGTRAANGVILITTKRAGEGKFSVDADFSYGMQAPTMLPEYVGIDKQMMFEDVKRFNEGTPLEWSVDAINAYRDGLAQYGTSTDQFQNNDWYDAVLKDFAPLHREQVSISGGSEKVRALMSFVNMGQEGLMHNSDFNRRSLRTNVDIHPTEWLQISGDLFVKRSVQVEPAQNMTTIMQMVNELEPYRQLYVNKGKELGDELLWGWAWRGEHPLAFTKDGGNETTRNNYTMLNLNAAITPFKGLRIDLGYSNISDADNIKRFQEKFPYYEAGANVGDPPVYLGDNPSQNNMQLTERSFIQNYYKAIATYENTLAADHYLKVLLGFDATDYKNTSQFGSRTGFPLGIDYPSLSVGNYEGLENGSSESEWAIASLLGRINYSFGDRYLFEGSFRYDGSSRFHSDNRWGFFPSVSAGWRISEESFMENLEFLNSLKLRASWGQLGNQNIPGLYPYMSLVDLNQWTILAENNQLGAAVTQWAVPNISWETSSQTNIGLDFGLLNNRLSGSFDYYLKKNDNVLLLLALPLSSGLAPNYQNGASIENKGWEFILQWRKTSDRFHYYVTGQIDDNKNKVLDLLGTGPYISGDRIIEVGSELNALYGWEAIGMLTAEELTDESVPKQPSSLIREGSLKFKDQDGNGTIDAEDRVIIGSEIPRFNYSFIGGVGWKGFSLDVILQGVGKRDGYVRRTGQSYGDYLYDWEADFYLEPTHPIFTDHHYDQLGLEPNTDAKYPALGLNVNGEFSDFWIQSRAYLRIKNLTLSYSLPQRFTSSIGISRIRVYVTADNLYTFTSFIRGFDPEMTSGRGYWQYPNISRYLGGISVSF